MQIKNNYPNVTRNLWLAFRFSVLVACVYLIYQAIVTNEVDLTATSWPNGLVPIGLLVGMMMILNWGLEALRWMVSTRSYESISYQKAVRVILSGLALNWVMPFTAGDAIARVVPMVDKYKTTSALIFNRGIMILLTGVFGLYSMQAYAKVTVPIEQVVILIFILSLIVWILSIKYFKTLLSYFFLLERKIVLSVIIISIFRYGVFVLQHYLMLSVFNPQLGASIILAGIGFIFFAKSVLPSFLGGAGLREASAVLFYSEFVNDITTILVPVFIIWIINTVIPSVGGLVAIWQSKFQNPGSD